MGGEKGGRVGHERVKCVLREVEVCEVVVYWSNVLHACNFTRMHGFF